MSRRFTSGLLLGLFVGAVLAFALFPHPSRRLRSFWRWLVGFPSVRAALSQTAGVINPATHALRARYDLAWREAGQTAEQVRRDLWVRFNAAKNRGRMSSP